MGPVVQFAILGFVGPRADTVGNRRFGTPHGKEVLTDIRGTRVVEGAVAVSEGAGVAGRGGSERVGPT